MVGDPYSAHDVSGAESETPRLCFVACVTPILTHLNVYWFTTGNARAQEGYWKGVCDEGVEQEDDY